VEPVVLLDVVGVSLGGKPVLRDLDLEVNSGETVGIWGPNGSGKTTIVRMLATLIKPRSGFGSVLGRSLTDETIFDIRPQIGMIGHIPALLPELTLHENLTHFARLAGLDEDRVGPALDVVGLDDAADRRANDSSFGMKRRVEVAHLLLSHPRLLLLDEATSGLDEAAQDLIGAVIQRTAGAGGAAVMVSHDAASLRESCDRVFHLASGRLREAS
jgi:heme ABC exporter ATP-binding subunit CcmA